MADRNIVATKSEQQIVQKDSASDHSIKCAAADCWKPGLAHATSGQPEANSRDAQNAASSEKVSALGFPKTDLTTDSKNPAPDTRKFDQKGHLLSAGDEVKAEYKAQGNLSKAKIDGQTYEKKGNDAVENYQGNDGKSHTNPEKQAHEQKLTEHLKSAGHRVKARHHHTGNSIEATIGGDNSKDQGSDAVEKFTGIDGKLHTFTAYNLSKFMPNTSDGNHNGAS
jgi:hypothetical protein